MNREEEFYNFLYQTPNINLGAFENNWPYIIQSTRNNIYTKQGFSSIVYYTYRKKDIVIVNSLGLNRKKLIVDFCKKLNKNHNIRNIILKNVDVNELKWWIKNGFELKTTPWSKYSKMDDNSFPQYNVSTETVEKMDFKNDIQRQIKSFIKKRKIFTEEYKNKYDFDSKNILLNFSKYCENKGTDYAHEVYNAHTFFFDKSIKNKIRLQHIENNKLIGISFLTPVSDICFYNMVICKYERNLMKYLVYQSMNFVIKEYPNIKLFGMQGSENEGQDYLKRRLRPSEKIKKIHLIYKKNKNFK